MLHPVMNTVLSLRSFQLTGITPFTSLVRSDFHFRPFERISVAFPFAPDDALPVRRITSRDVYPIQVSVKAGTIPPTTCNHLGTVTAGGILIFVNG